MSGCGRSWSWSIFLEYGDDGEGGWLGSMGIRVYLIAFCDNIVLRASLGSCAGCGDLVMFCLRRAQNILYLRTSTFVVIQLRILTT